MHVKIDLVADAAKIAFSDTPSARGKSVEVGDGVLIDYGTDGKPVGVEVLWISSRMRQPAHVDVELAAAPELLDAEHPLSKAINQRDQAEGAA